MPFLQGEKRGDPDKRSPEEPSQSSRAGVPEFVSPTLFSFLHFSSFFPPVQIRGLQDNKMTFIERVLWAGLIMSS